MTSFLRRQWGGIAFLLILTAIVAAWTWTRSGDPFLDSAKDLYTAQQMSHGRALYGDLCYLFGPLAPSILAVAFRVFGASVQVERGLNLILFLPVLLVLYRLLIHLSDRLAATAACAIYVALFAFGHLTNLRNYNILTPYTNSATYGLGIGIVMLAALVRFARNLDLRWLALAAMLCGLSFLTKPEIFLACLVTFGLAMSMMLTGRTVALRKAARAGLVGLACLLVTPLFLVLLLSVQSSGADVLSGVFAGYRMALDPRLHEMRFQLESAGLRFWRQGLQTSLFWLCAYGWILLPALLIAIGSQRVPKWQRWIGWILSAICCSVVIWLPNAEDWADIFRGVPFVVALTIVLLVWELIRARRSPAPDAPIVAGRLIFAIFALLMLSRMILNARIYQYGFVLAAPAMMLVVMAGLSWVPRQLDRIGRSGWIFKAATMGMFAGFVLMHLALEWRVLATPMIDMGHGYRASGTAADSLKQAMTELESRAKPGDTLAALPSATWANFVSGLPNPTPYDLLDPLGFIRAGGEDAVLEAFRSRPPTWIMLVHQDTSEYGATFFGRNYAMHLSAWIDSNYDPVTQFGAKPFQTREFGIALLRLHEGQSAP